MRSVKGLRWEHSGCFLSREEDQEGPAKVITRDTQKRGDRELNHVLLRGEEGKRNPLGEQLGIIRV